VASVNEQIADDLVPHDVDNRRVAGDLENRVIARLAALERELADLNLSVNPAGARQRRSKIRRLRVLNKRSRELTATAFSEINAMVRGDLGGLVRTEEAAVVGIIEKVLNG